MQQPAGGGSGDEATVFGASSAHIALIRRWRLAGGPVRPGVRARRVPSHADLSTVSRYAHVATREMHTAVQALADQAGLPCPQEHPDPPQHNQEALHAA